MQTALNLFRTLQCCGSRVGLTRAGRGVAGAERAVLASVLRAKLERQPLMAITAGGGNFPNWMCPSVPRHVIYCLSRPQRDGQGYGSHSVGPVPLRSTSTTSPRHAPQGWCFRRMFRISSGSVANSLLPCLLRPTADQVTPRYAAAFEGVIGQQWAGQSLL